jgi:hypothetical protein
MRPAWREFRKTRNKTPYSAQHLRPRFARGFFFAANNFGLAEFARSRNLRFAPSDRLRRTPVRSRRASANRKASADFRKPLDVVRRCRCR